MQMLLQGESIVVDTDIGSGILSSCSSEWVLLEFWMICSYHKSGVELDYVRLNCGCYHLEQLILQSFYDYESD
jgi:hypothetical protein